jgi:hypothetical protein
VNSKLGDISLHSSDDINMTSIDSVNIVGMNRVSLGKSMSQHPIVHGTKARNMMASLLDAITGFCSLLEEKADPEIQAVQHITMKNAVLGLKDKIDEIKKQYVLGDQEMLSKKVFAE